MSAREAESVRCQKRENIGLVSRVQEDGTRVGVPFGVYEVEELGEDRYRFSGVGLPTFELDGSELVSYIGTRMKIIEREN